MDAIDSLVKDHAWLKQELSRIAEEVPNAAVSQAIREFALKYQRHEEVEDVLFNSFIETISESTESWPLRGYKDVHEGARTLLQELQNAIDSGRPLSIQRAFSNFHLMALSHFEYEENWIFPLIKKGRGRLPETSGDPCTN